MFNGAQMCGIFLRIIFDHTWIMGANVGRLAVALLLIDYWEGPLLRVQISQ